MIEVRSADRPGVHLVCARAGRLDISSGRRTCHTLGPQAVDVFYVQEAAAGALSEHRAAGPRTPYAGR